ncbi:MAG TPA: hypothetical protein VLX44_09605 [Xanthobacteraceae bacterium]|nr:hypothetical protein [Xanthobacteraceae bacterium]
MSRTNAAIVSSVLLPSVIIGGLLSAAAAADEPALPTKPFFAQMSVLSGQRKAVGPGAKTLGVTSLTITNFNNTVQQLFIFAPVMDATSCGGQVTGGGNPSMHLILAPSQTLHLTYPSALVFAPINGVSCVAGEVTTVQSGGSVEIDVNGFVQ